MPSSICFPPAASAPDLIVKNPTRIGSSFGFAAYAIEMKKVLKKASNNLKRAILMVCLRFLFLINKS
jgi:hypothetical protein